MLAEVPATAQLHSAQEAWRQELLVLAHPSACTENKPQIPPWMLAEVVECRLANPCPPQTTPQTQMPFLLQLHYQLTTTLPRMRITNQNIHHNQCLAFLWTKHHKTTPVLSLDTDTVSDLGTIELFGDL